MSVILAIDAAWTEGEPSGVAAMVSSGEGWRCAAVAPSYETFLAFSHGVPVDWTARRFDGSVPEATLLLDAASRLAGARVDLVTIDMPVATIPITGRRAADNAVSREYGGRGCSTHTPSAVRPGQLGATLSSHFKAAGYSVATAVEPAGRTMRLVEVYPHPALLTLLRRPYRVQYKVAKALRYWPTLTVTQRIAALVGEFRVINEAITRIVGPVALPLSQANAVSSLAALKRYEDAVDALLCAWVGVCYLEGTAVPFGDETAAIWCPIEVAGPSVEHEAV